MSPSPEPVAPSPEIQKALESLTEVAGPWIEGIVGHEAILPILTRLYLAAKIEGKEEDARLECHGCALGWPLSMDATRTFQRWFGPEYRMWSHKVPPHNAMFVGPDCQCDASAIHDTLAKLREEAK